MKASGRHQRRLDIVRLVLAGPDPESVQDDPQAQEVLAELCEAYGRLGCCRSRARKEPARSRYPEL
jgi:hypothetical protein